MSKFKNVHTTALGIGRFRVACGECIPLRELNSLEEKSIQIFIERGYLVPAEETLAEETLAEETLAEETPAEETPAEETPAEETQKKKTRKRRKSAPKAE